VNGTAQSYGETIPRHADPLDERSVDGFITDREGGFAWTSPSDELFGFHTAQVRELGGYLLGRRLYETMLVWETDPSLRDNEARSEFADVWCAIPKVVFSRARTPFLPTVVDAVRAVGLGGDLDRGSWLVGFASSQACTAATLRGSPRLAWTGPDVFPPAVHNLPRRVS
jgi:hypothetical protein